MILRNRFLITVAVLCHLILLTPLVTSQLPPVDSPPPAGPPAGQNEPKKSSIDLAAPCARAFAEQSNDRPTLCAITQEKDGDMYKLHGVVEIYYETYVLKSDEATFNSDTNEATATGHFTLDGGPNDDHIRASHGTYNFALETGEFFDATGTTGIRFRGNKPILTSTAPFAFSGKRVGKISPVHYLVYDGSITTCELPHPKWQFQARKVDVEVGGNAKIYRSEFFLHGLPIFYFPYATHPVEKESRQSGFLIPAAGHSSTKGTIVGDAYYWAINRMMDATVGAEYFSMRGWSQRGEFRARPSDTSYVDLNYFGVIDRGIGTPPVKQGGENARLNAAGNLDGFRGVANIDYLSSFLFRLAFNEVFSQAVYSEVKSQAFLSKSVDGFNLNAFTGRYQNFLSTTPGQVVTILHAPSFDFSSVDQQIGRSPFYWSFDASAAGLSRSEPAQCSTDPTTQMQNCTAPFRTASLLGRFDLNPDISLPALFHGWSFRPGLTLHETFYTERLVDEGGANPGQVIGDPINRRALDAYVELRPPAIERVFNKEFLGRKWKHVVEPRAVYRFVTGVNNYDNIVKFDERDILTDTHEVEYGFVTRLYAKRTIAKPEDCNQIMTALTVGGALPSPAIPWQHTNPLASTPCQPGPQVREIVTWELAQKYFLDPTFGGALIPGLRNVFTSTADLTGIAFVTEARHLSPLVSRLRVETSSRTDAEWDMDYDFQNNSVNASTVLLNYHIGNVTMGAGDAFLQIPTQTATTLAAQSERFNQYRAALGYGSVNKRGFSAAGSFGYDQEVGKLQFVSTQATYNWDCCGMTIEYRGYTVANVRNENLFRFTFTLANIGSFGSLRHQESLY
jgi:LPS-assembly protein